jgi:hypothetical protein
VTILAQKEAAKSGQFHVMSEGGGLPLRGKGQAVCARAALRLVIAGYPHLPSLRSVQTGRSPSPRPALSAASSPRLRQWAEADVAIAFGSIGRKKGKST